MAVQDLAPFTIAIVICTAAIGALAGHLIRPGPKDRLLLWFGVFAGIYGVRMFFKQPLARSLAISPRTGGWVENGLNYFILVPALLFVEGLYGAGWRRSVRWLTVATTAFAVLAVAINVTSDSPNRVPDPSLPLLGVLFVLIAIGTRQGYIPPPFGEWRLLLAGNAVFMLFVLNEHAVAAGLVPWRFAAEPIGFLAQLLCFGYVALTRVSAQARQLSAIEQELRSAREIQASILPRTLPVVGSMQIAARYEPLAAVAGDFYDVVALNAGAVATIVADVSGHGLPAALIASMVKVAFTTALRDTHDPAALLQRMNAALCGMFERSYVTAVCAVVRPEAARLEYAIAGHPPPLLLRAGGDRVELLDERGLFLGVIPSAAYSTGTVEITSGTRLIFYTDGVTETPDGDDDLFGMDRLMAYVTAERRSSAAAVADGLVDTLRRFAGEDTLRHDDVTIVVVDCGRSGRREQRC